MSQRLLGNSDLSITPIGLGTWAIGGESAFGWGPQDDAESIATIHHAVESGINWLDTAPVYGQGRSETVVGQALADYSERDRPQVFTKCGLVWDDNGKVRHHIKADSIKREVDDSLRRLGLDVIDLYQIHWPVLPSGDPAPDIEEAWQAMAEIRDAGKVRCIGISNFDAAQMARIADIAPITSLQPPYSMLSRDIQDDILPYCAAHNIGVIAYSPMHNGLLSGSMTRERIAALPDTDFRKHNSEAFQEPLLTRNLEFVEFLREIGRPHGRSVAEVAVAWTLRDPVVTGAIVGARRPAQVDGFIGAMEFRLSDEEIARIDDALPPSIPLI
jgi:aryl-alcohol dehydrogenase-like predicted oxidoreductase